MYTQLEYMFLNGMVLEYDRVHHVTHASVLQTDMEAVFISGLPTTI